MELKPFIIISWILTPLDWFVFIAVIAATLLAIFFGHRQKEKQTEEKEDFLELLLMGRRLTLPMFVATLVATWYGGIFGVTAIAFEQGIYNFLIQGLFWYITYIIFACWLVNKVRSKSAATLAELVGEMFGSKSHKIAALFNFFNVVPITYTISLGILLQMMFSIPLGLSMLLGLSFVVSYSMFGGLRSVVFSDLVQFFVMCSGVLCVLIFSMINFGGWGYLQEHLPRTHFDITGGESLGTTLVWGFIALSTLVDPNFYQRSLAAKSSLVAKRGILISTGIWLIFDLCTTFGAMYARAKIPEADSSQAYLIYSLQLLPSGLRGFFLSGIFATILSTIDSYLFIAGTSLSYDLAPKKWQNPKLYPLSIVIVGLLAIGLGLFFEGNIKEVWKTLGSYSASCLLFPVLLGHLSPRHRIGDCHFVITCLLGVLGVSFWRFYPWSESSSWQNIDELYVGVACTFLAIAAPKFFLSQKLKILKNKLTE